MFPHTITAWLREEEGRSVNWTRVLFTRCFWQEKSGASPSTNGDSLDRSVLLLVQGTACTLKRGDRIALGVLIDDEPPSTSATVNTIKAVQLGSSSNPHHFEVSAS